MALARVFRGVGLVLAVVVTAGACNEGTNAAGDGECSTETITHPDDAYEGTLVDAHVELTDPEMPARLDCEMGRNNVEHATLFAPMNPDDTFETESAYRDAVSGVEGRYLPFFRIPADDPGDLSRRALERVFVEVGLFFRGIGEYDLGHEPWRGRPLTEPPWPDVFSAAAKRGAFVALRVPRGGADLLEAALYQYPDLQVIVRWDDDPFALADVMRRHEGVYAVLNVARLSGLEEASDKESFLASVEETEDARLTPAVAAWLPVLQGSPGNVMWSSGVSADWHADPEVYEALVRFGRRMIDQLPGSHQPLVAVANARRIFGTPVPEQPDA